MPGTELWTDGLICAFEFIRGQRKLASSKPGSRIPSRQQVRGDQPRLRVPSNGFADRDGDMATFSDDRDSQVHHLGQEVCNGFERYEGSYWVPIGWARISELVQSVQGDAGWASQQFDFVDDEGDRTVADLAAPYWERPAGPIWWCHLAAGHPFVESWLGNAQWLHPAISVALRDESKLISEKMKHLLYEVYCF